MWIFAILIINQLFEVYAINGKCRALAIGGGTDRGAYEAGAIIGLIKHLPAGEAHWDVVTGIGTGSLDALILSQHEIGQESIAAAALTKFWSGFSYKQIYKDWPGWYIEGLRSKSGLFDSSPMKQTISYLGSEKFHRFLGVGTTDLRSGSYVFFNTTGQSREDLLKGVYASASDYGEFPVVEHKHFKLVSGHIKFSVDILHAINACYKLGHNQENVILDIVMGSGKALTKVDASKYKTFKVFMRYLEIVSFDNAMLTIENAKIDFPKVHFRALVFPQSHLPHVFYPYDYSLKQLKMMLNSGERDAKIAILMGNDA